MFSLSSISSSFVESDELYSLRWYRFGILLAGVLGLIGFLQTEVYVSAMSTVDNSRIRQHMVESHNQQLQITNNYVRRGGSKPSSGLVVYAHLFDKDELTRLKEAQDFVLNNRDFERVLRDVYGRSLKEVDAVIVPGWVIDTKDNDEQIGITDAGWEGCTAGKGETNVGGFTIRDYPAIAQRTTDGRPRIFLNANAFQSTSVTRLTLFHEMLHAMNIPGYYPKACLLTFAQNDLTYLHEYRMLAEGADLEGSGEIFIWILGVGAPWMLSVLIYWQYRTRRQIEVSGV